MVAEPEKFPRGSDVNAPSLKSAGVTRGELIGPRRRIVTDSPGLHPLPVTVRVLFQVNRNGCVAPFTSMPPETVMVAEEPSKPVKDTVERRIARIKLFMGEVRTK